jgi:transglutaminase-like putative cysteine protease
VPSDYSFRLSLYLSLGLACACLGYAEADLLPSGAGIAAVVLVMLAASFRMEGRFELGLAAANRLGVVLFVAAGVWLVTQFVNRNSLIYTVPLPASLLPYIGTMLLVAMPAKLLRPKHAGDWWALQGMGLASVALGCALAEDVIFGCLLTLYAVAAVGGLALFYLKREAGQVPPAPTDPWVVDAVGRLTGVPLGGDAPPPAVVASVPTRVRAAWRPAVGWLAVAAVVALPLFFLTPRSGGARWSVSGTNLETGYDSPQMTDLTRTGDLRVNTEVAFEVVIRDAAGRPFDDLPMGQRWRGVAFGLYDAGKWRGTAVKRLIEYADQAMPDQRGPFNPPPVTPDVLVADFFPQTKTSEPPVADPVRWRPGAGSPVWAGGRRDGAADSPWLQKPDAAFNARFAVPGTSDRYRQYLYPPADADPDLGTGFTPFTQTDPDPASALKELPGALVELPARTRRLLDRMAAAGTVPARATGSAGYARTGQVEPADWEAVARAFREHLTGGEYAYTLKLRRVDRRSDPIEDFLYRSKAGNCERFAAALVLMCRAVGVPARYVLGFRGHEPAGDGRYLVRQDHAHAWAEVLVPRGNRWHWLSLDPTPDGDGDAPASPLEAAAKNGRSFFNDFIVGYSPERRREAAATVWATVSGPEFLIGLSVVVLVAAVGVLVWTRRQARRLAVAVEGPTGWYGQVVAALTRAGFPPPVGATPAEYARGVGRLLGSHPAAGVPAELTRLFYAERFGGTPADPAAVEAGLRRLAALPPAPRPT